MKIDSNKSKGVMALWVKYEVSQNSKTSLDKSKCNNIQSELKSDYFLEMLSKSKGARLDLHQLRLKGWYLDLWIEVKFGDAIQLQSLLIQ